MSPLLISAIVDALYELVKDLTGGPTQADIEKTVRDAMVKAADIEMQTEFTGEKP